MIQPYLSHAKAQRRHVKMQCLAKFRLHLSLVEGDFSSEKKARLSQGMRFDPGMGGSFSWVEKPRSKHARRNEQKRNKGDHGLVLMLETW